VRTTLTLDSDVALAIKERIARSGEKLKDVVNEALREGLRSRPTVEAAPFKVEPLNIKLRPGIDPTKLNQLYDELETESFVEKMLRLESKP
jgi:hypothetical protein